MQKYLQEYAYRKITAPSQKAEHAYTKPEIRRLAFFLLAPLMVFPKEQCFGKDLILTQLLILPFRLLELFFKHLPDIIKISWIVIKWLFGIKAKPIEGIPYVLDGDTIAFDGDIRIRLYGLDAPEMDHPEGPLSKAFLCSLIEGKHVRVRIKSKDKYGRLVGILSTETHDDINALMVSQGYARAYSSFSRDYVALERNAKRQNRGLWEHGGLALHPELWRKYKR